jgi:hypothetical protein
MSKSQSGESASPYTSLPAPLEVGMQLLNMRNMQITKERWKEMGEWKDEDNKR